MNKRQKKKISKYMCLKHRNGAFIIEHYQLKSGRWTQRIARCFNCETRRI